MNFFTSLVVALALCLTNLASSSTLEKKRVLVLLESLAVKETHSIFFKQISDQGFTVDYKVADDPTIAIKKYGEYLYENLVIFAPSVEEFGGSLSSEAVIEFIDDGGNVLMAGGSNTGDAIKDIASECGFEADEEGSYVIELRHQGRGAAHAGRGRCCQLSRLTIHSGVK